MADAQDLKSCGPLGPCGFESRLGYSSETACFPSEQAVFARLSREFPQVPRDRESRVGVAIRGKLRPTRPWSGELDGTMDGTFFRAAWHHCGHREDGAKGVAHRVPWIRETLFFVAPVTRPSAGVGDGKYKDLFGKYFEDHSVWESPENAPSESARRFRLQETESKRIDFDGRERGGVFGKK